METNKDSGIVNDWAVETMKNPRYPLELFMRVITVSLETMKIVRIAGIGDLKALGTGRWSVRACFPTLEHGNDNNMTGLCHLTC